MGKINYWKRVRKVLRKSNVVLEVVDARFAQQMRDTGLEQSCLRADKKIIIVINKADLISKEEGQKIKTQFSKDLPTVLVSTRKKKGKFGLKKFINTVARKRFATVSVIGYPNSGKSSLINYLKGKKTAKTSITAGLTRGEQNFRLSDNITLIDTPGVLPYFKGGEGKLAVLAAKSPQDLKDPVLSAQKVLAQLKHNGAKEVFGVKLEGNDFESLLEKMALAKKRLKKGGEPDTETLAKQLVLDWQKGKIKI